MYTKSTPDTTRVTAILDHYLTTKLYQNVKIIDRSKRWYVVHSHTKKQI